MIDWPDGLVDSPDGKARLVPQKEPQWSSAVFVTADGIARRRWVNLVTKKWNWDADALTIVLDESGRPGYYLEWWMSLERVIALAWLYRAPDSSNVVEEKIEVELVKRRKTSDEEDGGLHARRLEWAESEEPDNEGDERIEGEKWKALSWWCGVIKCDSRYKISTQGRLKSPYTGRVTRGFAYDGRRRAHCIGAGLVDLTTASGQRSNVIALQPSIHHARQALLAGRTPEELASAAGIAVGTAWTYFARAAETVAPGELQRLVPKLVSADLWPALVTLRGDPRLGGSLNSLVEVVNTLLSARGAFMRSEHAVSELRLARLAVTAGG